jgi:hypothetical protein
MSKELIQYALTTGHEGNQLPLTKDERVLTTPGKYVLFAKLPIPSEEFARGLLITSDTL